MNRCSRCLSTSVCAIFLILLSACGSIRDKADAKRSKDDEALRTIATENWIAEVAAPSTPQRFRANSLIYKVNCVGKPFKTKFVKMGDLVIFVHRGKEYEAQIGFLNKFVVRVQLDQDLDPEASSRSTNIANERTAIYTGNLKKREGSFRVIGDVRRHGMCKSKITYREDTLL